MDIEIVALKPEEERDVPAEFVFGRTFANRMFTQTYTAGTGWHDAKIGPYQNISLAPSTAVLHYAQEIFEGLKAYRRPDGRVNLFRPWENMKRFNHSARRMAMPTVDEEEHLAAIVKLVELEQEWVPDSPGSSLYIRPAMIGIDPYIGLRSCETFLHFAIVGPVGSYFNAGFQPVPVWISDKYRRAVLGGVGDVKTGGNYAASIYVSEEVKKQGYSQVLWLDAVNGRFVEEVGAMNICFVYEGKHIVTPTLSGSILPGITRDSILKLSHHLGYEASEERIDVHDLLADIQSGKVTESFGCGTAAVITPVSKFGFRDQDYHVGDGENYPVSQRLFDELTDIQYGRVEDHFGWTLTI